MVLDWKLRADEGGGNRAEQIGTAMYWSKWSTPVRSFVSSRPQKLLCARNQPLICNTSYALPHLPNMRVGIGPAPAP